MVLADRKNSTGSQCDGESVFNEKGCSLSTAAVPVTHCGGLVKASYSGNLREAHCGDTSEIVVFSGGNHPTGEVYGGIDDTINNASAYATLFKTEGFMCSDSAISARAKSGCRILFASTHYRIDEYPVGPQKHSDVESFNFEMRRWVDGGGCGARTLFADVYNFTRALVVNHFNESLQMTHDRIHWSRTVNLIKVRKSWLFILARCWGLSSSHCPPFPPTNTHTNTLELEGAHHHQNISGRCLVLSLFVKP